MARLPEPGKDTGTWGEILNDYLSQSLDSSGALKADSVGAVQIKSSSVTNASIANDSITPAKLANAGQANGPALLDNSAQLPDTTLPSRLSATSLNATYATPTGVAQLKVWARNPDQLFDGVISQDANGAPISAAVIWPDGVSGTYTADTVSPSFLPAVDVYHVTRVVGGVTTTYTQPLVTRDGAGRIVNLPAIVVS